MARAPLDVSDLNSTSRRLAIMDLNEHNHHPHHHHRHHLHNHHRHHRRDLSMEDMDIDITDVPDTPDRLLALKSNSGGENVEEIQSSGTRSFNKAVHSPLRDQGKLASVNRRHKLFSRPGRGISIHNESEGIAHPDVMCLDSPPSSINASSCRRIMADQVSSKPCTTEFVQSNNDRVKVDGNTSAFTKVLSSDEKFRGRNKEKLVSLSPSHGKPSRNLHPFGIEEIKKKTVIRGNPNPPIEVGPCNNVPVDVDRGKRVHLSGDVKEGNEQSTSKSPEFPVLPRINRQRRLVRNGCISPNNISKNKSTVESNGHHTEKINGVKGKGAVGERSHVQEFVHFPNRSSLNAVEEVNVNEDASGGAPRSEEVIGGRRSARSRTTGDVSHLHEVKDPASFQHDLSDSSVLGSSSTLSDLDRDHGLHHVACNLGKRQRRRPPASRIRGESSSSVFDDRDIDLLWPSEGPSNAISASTRTDSDHHRPGLVIEIDETSPEVRRRSPQNITHVGNESSYARDRQVEADEILARELQEQFYELPEIGETDESLARALQQEEERQRVSSHMRQRVPHRDSNLSHLYRLQHQNSVARSTTRGSNRGRAPTSARGGAHLRDRFPGHSRTVSARARDFQFPPNMDVEMRIHILEMLEAAVGERNDRTNLLQVNRDFNENDYEMLLALDEGNHQHGGASNAQINGLPQSTVQTASFDEACSICLETPTTGDTIRHLPCLHKFHKDCIDPWLRRKTSCPICKSGIT